MRNWQPYCMGIMAESHPNPECRSFHFKIKLLNGDDYITDYWINNPQKPILTYAMVSALRKIEGVKKVSAWPYEIHIERAPLYTWEELEPAIKLAMAKYYPSKSAV
jgi:hypothetical protein